MSIPPSLKFRLKVKPDYGVRLLSLLLTLFIVILTTALTNRSERSRPAHSILHVSNTITTLTYGGDPVVAHALPAMEERLNSLNFAIDPRLQKSAAHILKRVVKQGSLLSSDALNFYLNQEGTVYWDTEQIYLETDQSHGTELLKLIENRSQAPHHFGGRVGLAERWVLFPVPKRQVLALIAHPRLILDPLAKVVVPDKLFRIGGSIENSITAVKLLTLNRDGRHRQLSGNLTDGRFEATLSLPEGQWTVEIIGEGPLGPLPLAQFELGSGRHPVNSFREPRSVKTGDRANPSELLTSLINESRQRYGLKPLVRNDRLDDIATLHTMDMVRNEFVGHASPNTGDVGNRLSQHRLAPSTYGENIARNTTIVDAHRSLMHSISHRLNILDPNFTDLGLGIRKKDGQWFVTELYARMESRFGYLEPSRAKEDSVKWR